MKKRDIIVIGASAGGIKPLMEIIKGLPKDFKASIFIVVHIPPYTPSNLVNIINRLGTIEAIQPSDGETIKRGKIYLASPDQHLLVEDDYVVVKKGPKENRFRPSVDALFRSAAYIYGSRVIGVILSGYLDDGTSGMWSVKRRGGLCIIQSPEDAEIPDMPANVINYVDVDNTVKASEIAPLLIKLINKNAPPVPEISEEEMKRMKYEIMIAITGNTIDIINIGDNTELFCPDCQKPLRSLNEGKLVRFRCNTGHAYTSFSLLSEITRDVDDKLLETIKFVDQTTILLEKIAGHFKQTTKSDISVLFHDQAKKSKNQSKIINKLTIKKNKMYP